MQEKLLSPFPVSGNDPADETGIIPFIVFTDGDSYVLGADETGIIPFIVFIDGDSDVLEEAIIPFIVFIDGDSDVLEEADETGIIPFIVFTDGDSDVLEEADETGIIPFIPAGDAGTSRLQNEFEILKWLGKGGFGDVIKVSDVKFTNNIHYTHYTSMILKKADLLFRSLE